MRPSHEPAKTFKSPIRLQDNPYYHMLSLGCTDCTFIRECGGLRTGAGVFDCMSLCTCDDPHACDSVCPKKTRDFVARIQEVKELNIHTAPRGPKNGCPDLPKYVPMIYHGSRRHFKTQLKTVAVPFKQLIDFKRGEARYKTRDELAKKLGISEQSEIILSGVDRDFVLEKWWEMKNRMSILKQLSDIRINVLTTQNFSLFTDVPRTDNLHSMKRIALCWTEMAQAGLQTALHINARTERDYANWEQFLRERPEVEMISFEFGTGAGRQPRLKCNCSPGWHF